MSVYGNIVIRSWNSPAPAGVTCDGQSVAPGFEGLHIFDISNLEDPALVATVPVPSGSHTHALAPDPANDRLIVYNGTSGGGLDEMAIIEVPLSNPAGTRLLPGASLAAFPGIHGCHDMAVFTGDVNLVACIGGAEAVVFDIADPANPVPLYSIVEDGSGIGSIGVGTGGTWHSGTFSWDGDILALGWEPGGVVAPKCQSTDDDVKKTLFFYDAATGQRVGFWTLPRAQDGFQENCTLHNFSAVPLRSFRRVIVMGNYQAGTNAVDFTDPANRFEFAYSDPDPVPPHPTLPFNVAGVWARYWYNNFVYETNSEEGLNIFRISGNQTAAAMRLDRLNPQTQEFRIMPKGK